jgi:D-glycero-alpha-D-manno-heptose 1-phosphate guanylyltransferase
MRAFILVGGLGTRLRSITRELPKPMITVAGKPFLEHLIEKLASQNIQDVILCVGYGAQTVMDYFENGRKWGIHIQYSQEKELLGTAGAIKNAEIFAEKENFVLNGDSFFDINYKKMLEIHFKKKAMVTIACIHTQDTGDYGNIAIDRDYRILGFKEKVSASNGGLISGGIYIFDRSVFNAIPKDQKVSLEEDIFPALATQGTCFAFPSDGYFIDIGTPERFERAQEEFKSKIYSRVVT